MSKAIVAAVLFLLVGSIWAAPGVVRVLALFPGKAMLEIDGRRMVVADGESADVGVVLVNATPNRALVEIEGRREELRLGSSVSTTYARNARREIRILRDSSGSYFVDGLINGQAVRFLVDTGATRIAMSEDQAARLGIRHRVDGVRERVATASGRAVAYRVELDSVSIEGLRLERASASVIEGKGPPYVLLGMTALGEFEIDQRENLMILRTRF